MTDFSWSHLLYRLFNAEGVLLYVGRTANFPTRMSGHAGSQPWWTEVARATVETLPTFEALDAAERAAIRAENPLYNAVRYAPPPLPRPEDEPVPRGKRGPSPKPSDMPSDEAVLVRPVDAICASYGRIPTTSLLVVLGTLRYRVEAEDIYDSTRVIVSMDELAKSIPQLKPKRVAEAVGHLLRAGWLIDHGAGVYDYSIPRAVFELGEAACGDSDCGIHGGERGETGPVAPVRVALPASR